MANAFEFYIGTGNNEAGSGVNYTAKASFRDIRIYRNTLTAEQRNMLYRNVDVPGYITRWKCAEYPLTDEAETYDLAGVNLSSSNIKEI
jgi:hypothetical protein